jgi:methylthioribose-1-phosphate isomerase
MQVGGRHLRSLWIDGDPPVVRIIDQRWLPHELVTTELKTAEQAAEAIRDMHVRGAPLIGAVAAAGIYLAARGNSTPDDVDDGVRAAAIRLLESRPTAINLKVAVQTVLRGVLKERSAEAKIEAALRLATDVADGEIERCRRIGEVGLPVLQRLLERSEKDRLNILTHCNAGWLACVDYGTASAPIFLAHDAGLPVHVWVDETRPRNQGARLTAWEFAQHGVPHTVVVDNAGGHLMQRGMVDVVLVGTDRTTYTGDVVNKIGTYLKALAARDTGVPFYVALPSSTIDWQLAAGRDAPIEERDAEEVRRVRGLGERRMETVLVTPPDSPAANYAFDVTPRELVTGLITERGVCEANEQAIRALFPDKAGTVPDGG